MGMDAMTVRGWAGHFEQLIERIGGCFARHDLRKRAAAYVRGLVGPVQRKNGWQLAEHVGDATPHAVQRLLDRASWDADAVRDELVKYARAHLLTERDPGVLIVDETGFLKKGDKSVGVQRQYSGTAGRIENCQVGVFLALSGPRGRALIDRELYLPKSWCEDEVRLRKSHVPPEVGFMTKPRLAQRMIARALDAPGGGLRPRWVLGDEVYGSDGKTRRFLEDHGQPYVLAVTSQQRLWVDFEQRRVDHIARDVAPEGWHRLSVAPGSKGLRMYGWAGGRFGAPTDSGLVHWLLIRRSISEEPEHAYYLCAAPSNTTLQDLAVAAGQRWAIECCFESAKQEAGLDDYEVRSWHGWHRHVTLSMAAVAMLAAVRAQAADTSQQKGRPITWSR
jgi:SRSO17 transposase